MTPRVTRLLASSAALLAVPYAVLAQQGAHLVVGTGTSFSFWAIINRIITYLTGAIAAVAMTMFVVGAFFITLSGAQEDYRQKGKDLIYGSLISLAVVLGAYAILRTVDYFLTT
jgi:hypothetical protein